MLSYRHAFHAGNHADVLKHFVQMQLLQYLAQKDKPYWVIDTHAGAGCYELLSGYAAKNAEYESGIARLWDAKGLPPALAEYVALVKRLNPEGKLTNTERGASPQKMAASPQIVPPPQPSPGGRGGNSASRISTLRLYPGSPLVSQMLLREQDRLRLFELHPSDYEILTENFIAHDKQVMVQKSDGFAALKALLPPPPRRALVLIDPPYEEKQDYKRVVEALQEGLQRFATGTYAVWYPCLQREEAERLPDKLKRLPVKSWLHVALHVQTPSEDGFGMHGSGMFVLNPPWTLHATLQEVMPKLVALLGQDAGARFVLEQQAA